MATNPADIAMLRNLCQSLRRRSSRLAAMAALPSEALLEAEMAVHASGAMEDIIQARFDQAATDGVAWPERKKAVPWPLLQKTGRLLAAAKNAVSASYRVSGTRWAVGRVMSAYARYVHDGTTVNAARPFFSDPSEEELKPADKIAARAARRALKRIMR